MRASKIRALKKEDIPHLLSVGPLSFLVADVGKPLSWIPAHDTFHFLKAEAHRIADTERFSLEDFPENKAYVASEWASDNGDRIIVLEAHH